MPGAGATTPARLLAGAGLVLLYVGSLALGRETRPDDGQVALAWPAAGIGVWLLWLVRGRTELVAASLAVAASALLVNALTGVPALASGGFALVNAAHCLTGRALLRRLLPGGRLTDPGHVAGLLLASTGAGVVSGMSSALVVWALLDQAFLEGMLLFVVRNGGTTFVILVAVLSLSPPHGWRELRSAQLGLISAGTAAAYAVVFMAPGNLPTLFIGMGVTVLAATRLGIPHSGLLAFVISSVAVVATLTDHGNLSEVENEQVRAVLVQAFAVVLTGVSLLLTTLRRCNDALSAQLAQALRLAEEADRSALIGKAVVTRGADGGWFLARANPALVSLLGRDPTGRRWREVLRPEDSLVVRSAVDEIAGGTQHRWQGDVGHLRADGTTVWTQMHVSRLPSTDGSVSLVAQVLDITERRAAHLDLERRAHHDELTGLPKRTALQDYLQSMLSDSAAGETVVLFLDLDHFKSVNDTYGHAAGDRLLVQVAEALQSSLRPGDLVSRLGGDEFVVCCTGVTTPAQALDVVQRLEGAVRPALLLDGEDVGLGLSFGYALAGSGDNPGELVQRADEAMYRTKRGKRADAPPEGAVTALAT